MQPQFEEPLIPTGSRPAPIHFPVYIGTNVEEKDVDTIFHFRLNVTNGELLFISATKAGQTPSYLTLDKNRSYLYAALEKEEAVKAFKIDASSGALTLLSKQDSKGGPCYISLDHTNKFALAANYDGGSVDLFPVKDDGSLDKSADKIQHHGSSINKDRQESGHAHYINMDPTNKYAFAVDLGKDQVIRYKLDLEKGKLVSEDPQSAYDSKPGSGPRHIAFHPNDKYAYLIHELGSTVSALAYDANNGTFKEINTLSALPEGWKGENTAAAIHLLPNGKFLYGSNRGHDSIVVYSIDEATGGITLVEHVSAQGKGPRDFEIDPTGKFLVAANEKSNDVFVYSIDQDTGKLTKTNNSAQVPHPVCVKIVRELC